MEAGNERASGFEIDGELYQIPTLVTLNLDEERLLFIYADAVIADFVPPHPDWTLEEVVEHRRRQADKIRNPAFKRALAHIAYRRRHPDIEDAVIEERLGTVSAVELDIAVLDPEQTLDDEDPPTPTSSPSEPGKTSEQSPPGNGTAFGRRTESSSDQADESPGSIGITESDISSPGAPPTVSASSGQST